MIQDFGQSTHSMLSIMTNISALKRKIEKGEQDLETYHQKVKVWKKELDKAKRALDRRRCMA